tara:strand:- start:265 stop:774 length:510 start_codon:yes stop_codon:yes gene_type:complete
MIITCINCDKKFDLDSKLIPDEGRLLQCNGCSHKWFFKEIIKNEPISSVKSNKQSASTVLFKDISETEMNLSTNNDETLDTDIKEDFLTEKNTTNQNVNSSFQLKTSINKKNFNILNLIFVFIISFIALIIIIDTFQAPISKVFPNIEFILYNLYETINDINLFIKDLI